MKKTKKLISFIGLGISSAILGYLTGRYLTDSPKDFKKEFNNLMINFLKNDKYKDFHITYYNNYTVYNISNGVNLITTLFKEEINVYKYIWDNLPPKDRDIINNSTILTDRYGQYYNFYDICVTEENGHITNHIGTDKVYIKVAGNSENKEYINMLRDDLIIFLKTIF